MTRVGVRALKDHLSEYLRRVGEGERIVVTDRGQPLATLTPVEETDEARWGLGSREREACELERGETQGKREAPDVERKKKKTTSQIVLESRR